LRDKLFQSLHNSIVSSYEINNITKFQLITNNAISLQRLQSLVVHDSHASAFNLILSRLTSVILHLQIFPHSQDSLSLGMLIGSFHRAQGLGLSWGEAKFSAVITWSSVQILMGGQNTVRREICQLVRYS